jgi:hypothetical protein
MSRAHPSWATPHHGARWARNAEQSHTQAGGQPQREQPAEHLDRIWPDTGPKGIVWQPRSTLVVPSRHVAQSVYRI